MAAHGHLRIYLRRPSKACDAVGRAPVCGLSFGLTGAPPSGVVHRRPPVSRLRRSRMVPDPGEHRSAVLESVLVPAHHARNGMRGRQGRALRSSRLSPIPPGRACGNSFPLVRALQSNPLRSRAQVRILPGALNRAWSRTILTRPCSLTCIFAARRPASCRPHAQDCL